MAAMSDPHRRYIAATTTSTSELSTPAQSQVEEGGADWKEPEALSTLQRLPAHEPGAQGGRAFESPAACTCFARDVGRRLWGGQACRLPLGASALGKGPAATIK